MVFVHRYRTIKACRQGIVGLFGNLLRFGKVWGLPHLEPL